MRSYRQSRSLVTLSIWTAALLVMAGLAAWQYGWITEAEPRVVADRGAAKAVEPEPSPAAPLDLPEAPQEDAEPSLFVEQSEPPFEETSGAVEPAAFAQEPPPWEQEPEAAAPRILATPSDARPIPPPFEEPSTPPTETLDFQPQPQPPPDAEPYRRVVPAGGEAPPVERTALNTPDVSVGKPEGDASLAEIDHLIEQGQFDAKNYIAAHKALSEIYWNEPERRPEIQERIDRTARVIYFSPQPHVMTPYVINPGENLTSIARTYHVPWEFLARLNGVQPRSIQAGQRLKVIKGPFSAVIELSRFELTVHHHGYYVRRYPIGIGKDGATPTGEFEVLNKQANPEYTFTDPQTGLRRRVPADDPENPIGERWIDLGDSYGIHGTIDPDSIGKAESAGCIRMHNADVEEVYDLLGKGSKVVIRP